MKIWLAMVLAGLTTAAGAEMWKCVDADGNTRYTNVRSDVKGCKPLHLDPPTPVPAPAQRAQQAQPKPANFPSVDGETQKQRDAGRRKILEQELAQEQQQLDVAKKELAAQQDVRLGSEANYARVVERLRPFEERVKLHESNIDSIKREIGSIR